MTDPYRRQIKPALFWGKQADRGCTAAPGLSQAAILKPKSVPVHREDYKNEKYFRKFIIIFRILNRFKVPGTFNYVEQIILLLGDLRFINFHL